MRSAPLLVRVLQCLPLLSALVAFSCGPPDVEGPFNDGGDAGHHEAGEDDVVVDVGFDVPADARTCMHDADCDDGVFCNGIERCIGGVCGSAPPPCDDHASCTMDGCDESARMCTHTPDDSMCGDHNACNGVERCAPGTPGAMSGTGCQPVVPGNIIDCDDGNTCTIDDCDVTAGCVHAPRDLDGDGHVDRACTVDGTPTGVQGDDCDDSDPDVYPGAPEICTNGRDDNCNMLVDYEEPTCNPTNDTCATATMLPGPGMYVGAVRGLHSDYMLSCNATTTPDAVFAFTLTSPQDVTISSSATGSTSALALLDSCSPYSETRCNAGTFSGNPSIRVHSLPAGTYYFVAEAPTSMPTFRITLTYAAPTPVPPEDTCPPSGTTMPAVDISDGTMHTAHLATLEDDYMLSCSTSTSTVHRDAVYRITVDTTSDVRVTATATTGQTYVSFRSSPCELGGSQLRCQASGFSSSSVAVVQRSLGPGTYWVIVENDNNSDVNVQATITPPGARLPDDLCPSTGTTPSVDISDGMPHVSHLIGLSDDYALSCNSFATNGLDGVYRITLTATSDVHIAAAGTSGTTYASFRTSACSTAASQVVCRSGTGVPNTVSFTQRSLAAGTYWVVVENSANADVTVTATITPPGSGPPDDLCPPTMTSPVVELNDGMPHVAHLTALSDDYMLSCNSFTSTGNDGVYRLTLAAPMDLHLSATATTGTTYVSFRGSPCNVMSSEMLCRSGFSAVNITERALPAGTYWVIVENSSNSDVTLQAMLGPPSAVVRYTATDSPTGVSFVDACAATGHTNVLRGTDDGSASIPSTASPFTLRMYNVNASPNMTVCSNGWFSLLTTGSDALSGTIPDPTEPNLMVAPEWMDLITSGTDGICYATTGTAPNRKFVVEWSSASEFSGGGSYTFEIIFNEAPTGMNNIIDVVYQSLSTPASHTPQHGIEDDTGTLSTAITGSFTGPRVVRLTPM